MKTSFLTAIILFSILGLGIEEDKSKISPDGSIKYEKATFAGGCFWCMEPPFDKIEGVVSTTSGYTGGDLSKPEYKQVSAGITGHAEAVEILYDPNKVNYKDLLDIFWMNIDPTTLNKQFADVGSQYRTAIYYHNADQKKSAIKSKKELIESHRFSKPIVTEITPTSEFYPAEEYHQDYYKKNPIRYKLYRSASGRDRYLKKIWGLSQ